MFVGLGRVGLGITGLDQVKESRTTEVEQILDLGFGKCKLQVQVPQKGTIQDPIDLVGKNVVTSFVQLTRAYFEQLEMETGREGAKGSTNIQFVGGSVEAACALGVADGIVDLVGQLNIYIYIYMSLCSCFGSGMNAWWSVSAVEKRGGEREGITCKVLTTHFLLLSRARIR